jgi:AhpD family alkylhydroperoxidase
VVPVRDIAWEACLLAPRRDPELERRLRKESGWVPGPLPYFFGCPWAQGAIATISARLGTHVYLEHHLADLVGLVVSQDNSCRYCYAAQRAILRMLGFPQQRISQLEQDFLTAELEPRERMALDFARRLSRSDPLPSEADKEPLRQAGFAEMEVKELAAVAGLHVFFNRVSTLPALPPQTFEELPDKWYVRLLRPLLVHRVTSMQKRGTAETLSNEQKVGPFSYVVLGLDGLPVAGELRGILDAMWRSPILHPRSKALVFAVVARAIGCPKSEQESVRLLLAEGLHRSDVDEILAHLACPKLDRTDALIAPFARETVWCEPARIQRSARKFRDTLSHEQLLELIAVASLANAVCRLGIVVDAC